MARKTQPYVCDMSVHASVFYISCLVFSSTFADNSPYLNRIGGHPAPRQGTVSSTLLLEALLVLWNLYLVIPFIYQMIPYDAKMCCELVHSCEWG